MVRALIAPIDQRMIPFNSVQEQHSNDGGPEQQQRMNRIEQQRSVMTSDEQVKELINSSASQKCYRNPQIITGRSKYL